MFLCQGRAQLNSVISPRREASVKTQKASLSFREIWSSNSSATERNEIFIRAVWGSETFIRWEIPIRTEGGIGLRRNVVRKTCRAPQVSYPQVRSAGSTAPGLSAGRPARAMLFLRAQGVALGQTASRWTPACYGGLCCVKTGGAFAEDKQAVQHVVFLTSALRAIQV